MLGKEDFDGSQPITIIPFFMDFRLAGNNADVHEMQQFGCCHTSYAEMPKFPTKHV